MNSEQDKRAVYMGTFERYRKEMNVKHDDVMLQLALTKKVLKYAVITSTVAFILGVAGIAI